jgi:aspartate-semialdehyde dehydrogenase
VTERCGTASFRVAVLGATGAVGQRFVALLEDHPYFHVGAVMASPRSAGKPYGEAVRWVLPTPIPERVARMTVRPLEPDPSLRVAFSALDSDVAGAAELEFARAGVVVFSNASSHRMGSRVPLVVPEVNPDHLSLASAQEFGEGAIYTNPNCSTIGLSLALAPLELAFGIEAVHAVTLQALSGAGLPGLAALRAQDNVLPSIPGEEEKIEQELPKILGALEGDSIRPAELVVSARCNRVPVKDGHTACVSVALRREATAEQIVEAWRSFRGAPQEYSLPSAPAAPVVVLEGDDAPQPRLHRDLGSGMSASVGRLRAAPPYQWQFTTVSHNTVRGAAGGAILLAELALAEGLLWLAAT